MNSDSKRIITRRIKETALLAEDLYSNIREQFLFLRDNDDFQKVLSDFDGVLNEIDSIINEVEISIPKLVGNYSEELLFDSNVINFWYPTYFPINYLAKNPKGFNNFAEVDFLQNCNQPGIQSRLKIVDGVKCLHTPENYKQGNNFTNQQQRFELLGNQLDQYLTTSTTFSKVLIFHLDDSVDDVYYTWSNQKPGGIGNFSFGYKDQNTAFIDSGSNYGIEVDRSQLRKWNVVALSASQEGPDYVQRIFLNGAEIFVDVESNTTPLISELSIGHRTYFYGGPEFNPCLYYLLNKITTATDTEEYLDTFLDRHGITND